MENFRNHGPQAPQLYERQEYVLFSDKIAPYVSSKPKPLTHATFLELSREAITAKKSVPELRADIAYGMVCVGSQLPERRKGKEPSGVVKEIYDLFTDLEVPDGHIVTPEAAAKGDFSEVDQKWQQIADLLASHA